MTDTGAERAMRGGAGMACPVCKVDLVMSERQGIEIDYCPKCRGIWLDRGELDKIIERSARESEPTQSAHSPPPPPRPQPTYDPRYDHHHGGYGHGGYRKRKSWLEDLFD